MHNYNAVGIFMGLVGVANGDEKLVDRMINSVKHRKWYRVDKYVNSSFGIARVHLGIFNPEPQPIFNEDESLFIFMDGQIYGYQWTELKNKHQVRIGNGPEFCLHFYEECGKKSFEKLNGNFLLCIVNRQTGKITIVNDRHELRPLYYTINNGKLLFASEIKAILEDDTFKGELDKEAVADFFAFGEILGDRTFFKNVRVLPPVSIFTYDTINGRLSVERYWDFNYNPDYAKSEDEFVNELVRAFKEAVEIRMKGNHRYGVSLSGGLDSRAVLAAIGKNRRKNSVTFTYGTKDCVEEKIAKWVSGMLNVRHLFIEINANTIINNAEKCIYITDGRDYIGVSYGIPMHEWVKPYVDVMFDGFALDLTLGGSYLDKRIVRCKTELELLNILKDKRRIFKDKELTKLFRSTFYKQIKSLHHKHLVEVFNRIDCKNRIDKSDKFFLRTHISYIPIFYSMVRVSMETAYPTMDNNFIDVILRIPPGLRFNHNIHRKFLKKLSPELAKIPYNKTMIPADAPLALWKFGAIYQICKEKIKRIIWRVSKGTLLSSNKRVYVNPDGWFRVDDKWRQFFEELLLSKDTICTKFFNQKFLEKLFHEQVSGKRNNSIKILYLASLELFLRLYKDDIRG